jgi:phosphotriesterase-related protein
VEPAALTGTVVTVLGPVAPDELGVCLPHEHVICALDRGLDWSPGEPRARAFADEPLTLANLERIQRDPLGNRANLRLDDVDEMIAELLLYAAAGGRAVVDQTLDELGRDRAALAQVARATGLHVVAGCGHYVADLQSPRAAGLSVDELVAELRADLLADPGRGGIPCGLIGEIGVSSERIAPFELRMLKAVARVQRGTGAPVSIHSLAPGHMGLEALLVLKEHGVEPGKVAVCHLDSDIDLDYCREIAREGAFIEFDWFGWHAPGTGADGDDLPHSDRERVAAVAELSAEGLAGRLLLSHDIAMKIQLTAYGGFGYAHLIRNLPPFFARRGVDAATLRRIMVDNPARWLAWESPRER